MLPKIARRGKEKDDHVDAWLMSYADLITLLFIFFVIFVGTTYTTRTKPNESAPIAREQPANPYKERSFGLLNLANPFENVYQALSGVVDATSEQKNISVERTDRGVWIDISAFSLFAEGSADIGNAQMPLLQTVARAIAANSVNANIEVQGYTDDAPPAHSVYANNWELAAMRAARVANWLAVEGVDPARISAVSYGPNKPVVPNADAAGKPIDENRSRNQRIVIRMEKLQENPR